MEGRALSLDAADVRAIAEQVAELLRDDLPGAGLVETAVAARFLSASEDWVRDHAAELGAVRLGDGDRGELRFEAVKLRAFVAERRVTGPVMPAKRATGRRGARTVRLLPLPPEARGGLRG